MLTTLTPPNGDHLNDEIIQGVESLMYFNNLGVGKESKSVVKLKLRISYSLKHAIV